MKCGRLLDVSAYRKMAKYVHEEWYRLLPKVYMPVGLHILLKHVPEFQDLLGIPVGTTSEEALEHLHHIIRDLLRKHVVTSSLTTAHKSLIRYLLMSSSPTMAAKHPAFTKISHTEICDDLRQLLQI